MPVRKVPHSAQQPARDPHPQVRQAVPEPLHMSLQRAAPLPRQGGVRPTHAQGVPRLEADGATEISGKPHAARQAGAGRDGQHRQVQHGV